MPPPTPAHPSPSAPTTPDRTTATAAAPHTASTMPFALQAPTPQAVAAALLGVALLWVPVLLLHLVAALLAALFTYGATRGLAAWLHRRWPGLRHADGLALAIILLLLAGVLGGAAELLAHARNRPGLLASLIAQMAQILDQLRLGLPQGMAQHIPDSVEALRELVVKWLKSHAAEVQQAGGHAVRALGHAVIGVVIGALLALQLPARPPPEQASRPFERRLRTRFDELVDNFVTVVFAQGRIALLNAVLTAVYLLGILPLVGRPLPMAGTLVLVTFLCGLIPVFGNLISNSVIVVLSLSDSFAVALMSLAWLVSIHKLEYVLNARIIGSRIRAKAWEMLIAMILMEAAFGIAGLLTAPIIYAEIKQALARRGWID